MKAKKRCLSVLLSLAMLVTPCCQNVFATEANVPTYLTEDTAGYIISEISPLDETVVRQHIFMNGEGAASPILPTSLEAVAYQANQEPQLVTIEGITWTATPEYDPAIPGEYIFTPHTSTRIYISTRCRVAYDYSGCRDERDDFVIC